MALEPRVRIVRRGSFQTMNNSSVELRRLWTGNWSIENQTVCRQSDREICRHEQLLKLWTAMSKKSRVFSVIMKLFMPFVPRLRETNSETIRANGQGTGPYPGA